MVVFSEAEKLGLKLKELRTNKKITQTQLSQETKIYRLSYNKYENGKIEPSIQTLKTLADYHGVSVDNLLGHTTSNVVLLNVLSLDKQEAIKKIVESKNLIASKVNVYIDVLRDRDAEVEKEIMLLRKLNKGEN